MKLLQNKKSGSSSFTQLPANEIIIEEDTNTDDASTKRVYDRDDNHKSARKQLSNI